MDEIELKKRIEENVNIIFNLALERYELEHGVEMDPFSQVDSKMALRSELEREAKKETLN